MGEAGLSIRRRRAERTNECPSANYNISRQTEVEMRSECKRHYSLLEQSSDTRYSTAICCIVYTI